MSHQGRRKKAAAFFTDATCTPKWLADKLPEVDLDPCSNPRSRIRSRWAYSVEKGLDGLRLPWHGSVFRNNPFNVPLPWHIKAYYERLSGRCTEEIVLCKMETSTEWYDWLKRPIERDGRTFYPELWLFHERVEYEEHPDIIEGRRLALEAWREAGGKASGVKKPPPVASSNNFCSMIIHHRFDHATLNLWDVADLWMRCP